MWNALRLLLIFLSLTLVATSGVFAVDYPYKKIADFKTLESFKSVDEFESSYKKYTQHCLDNTYGGSGGASCFIGYDLWDRELNIYYAKLMKTLKGKERDLLKESQIAWIKERDKTIDFNSALFDKTYPTTGTMYISMRAGDSDAMMTPVVKQRALLLKKWLEYLGHERY